MKRVMLILSFVWGAVLFAPGVYAANGPAPAHGGFASLLAAQYEVGSSHQSLTAQVASLLRTHRSLLHRSAASLHLPPSALIARGADRVAPRAYRSHLHAADIDPNAFAAPLQTDPLTTLIKSGAKVGKQGVETIDKAATDLSVAKDITTSDLTAEGWQTGYAADVDVPTGQGMIYSYVVSIFGTSTQAAAAFTKQQTDWKAANGVETSISGLGVGDANLSDNYGGTFTTSDNKTVAVTQAFFSRGRILVDVALIFLSPDDVNNATLAQDALAVQFALAKQLDTIAAQQQGITTTQTGGTTGGTTTTTQFSVTSVSVHKTGDDNSPAIKKIKAGKKIYVIIDWTLTSSPPDAKPTYGFAASRAGKVTKKGTFQGSLASYPPDSYFAYFATKLKNPGTFTITGTVAMGGQTQQATVSLKVTK